MKPVLVLVTASSQEEARKIARGVLEVKLAACANIVAGVESHYWWQGKLESAAEWLVLMKSSSEQFEALSAKVKSLHSYQCPEIVAIEPQAIEAGYLEWWRGNVSTETLDPGQQ